MKAGRIVLLTVGSVVSLVALAVLAGGVALLVANHTERDSAGFFSSSAESYETGGYALVSDDLDLGTAGPDWLFEKGRLATLRLRGASTNGRELFIGIAPTTRVKKYLAGTSYDVVTDINLDPFAVTYRSVAGSSAPRPPRSSSIWTATATGAARQTLEWKVAKGNWSAVVMNADASRGVDASISLGAKIGLIFWVGLGLLIFGLFVLAGGGTMIYLGARRPADVTPSPAVASVP
jgi:hypothetical protein